MAPAITSAGKCTPKMMRDAATMQAQATSGAAGVAVKETISTTSKNAAEVCPEGKLNSSDAVINALNVGRARGGRWRLSPFFNNQYRPRSTIKAAMVSSRNRSAESPKSVQIRSGTITCR